MTQVSATPPPGAAPAPSDAAAPPVLAQAGQRAEFSARLLAALAALRGGVPPAPLAAESPASAELAVAPLEDASSEETAETPEETQDSGVPASVDARAELAPLVLLQLTSDEPPDDPSGGEGAPAETAAEPAGERAEEPATQRPASFAPGEGLLEQSAAAQLKSAAAQTASEDEAAPAVDAATASSAPARRGERTPLEAPRPASEPAPDVPLARGAELTTPPARTEQSESATATAGRVLPELPVRNEQEIVDQVRFLLNRRGGQASIELHPPQLGQLGLRISVTDHAVRLEITADRLQVAELLHKHLPELQHALEAQGLQIDRAQVDLRERGGDGRERGGDPGDAEARREARDFDDRSRRQPSYTGSTLPAYSLGAVDVHA